VFNTKTNHTYILVPSQLTVYIDMFEDIIPQSVALFLFFVTVHRIFYNLYSSPLSSIPGAHSTSSFLPFWMLWSRFRGPRNEIRVVAAAHKRYGAIVRLGPSEVSVNTPDRSLLTFHRSKVEKPSWYSSFANNGYAAVRSWSWT
jgi:hypothetical protein